MRNKEWLEDGKRQSKPPSAKVHSSSPLDGSLCGRNETRITCVSGNVSTHTTALGIGILLTLSSFAFLIFYLCIGQMYNNLVSQAGQMDLHGVPNDAIQALSGVACVILGPIIQGLYTFLAKHRITFGPIARIATAFFFCGAGMGYAAGIQKLIYASGPCYDRPLACSQSDGGKIPNQINVWIQLPIYFLLAVAEILGFVTAFEYAYNKAPKDMKTIVQALTQLTACLASALGMALSPVARDPHILIMYVCLAASMGVCTIGFWWIFGKYDAMDKELDEMVEDEAGVVGSSVKDDHS